MSANSRNIKIVMTGGGTAGHVVPHLALLPGMKKRSWETFYIGSAGIEKTMIEKTDVPFYTISAGKLRRYFSLQNFLDVFKVMFGCVQSLMFLMKIRPNLVFSKGGFVSVPVAVAAWALRIPVVTHESDLTPGLANKIVKRFCKKILFTFPETSKYLPKDIGVYVGSPVREEIFTGQKSDGYKVTGFSSEDSRPVVLVMGGSLGAKKLNDLIASDIADLTKEFRFVHLTGKGKKVIENRDGYVSFEFLSEELKDVYAMTDLIVARSGANSIFEFLALNKPMMLVPLEAGSRGDQLQNATSFVESGFATLKREGELKEGDLLQALKELHSNSSEMKNAQSNFSSASAIEKVLEQIEEVVN
ncbi:undecaprenyldiphospho-muramoylpentapeptide beta-N-acetylglucosaminyltransferase [bacterium]|nr:undecaprenyldiphospho-muramoylpentapeptide beta-N-acetylglucosaminyltransferase [bacterium]